MNEIFAKAVQFGAVIAMDFYTLHEGKWHKFSTSFYDSEEPNEDGLYRNVATYQYDLDIFTPQDRLASQSNLVHNPIDLDRYQSRQFNSLDTVDSALKINIAFSDYIKAIKSI